MKKIILITTALLNFSAYSQSQNQVKANKDTTGGIMFFNGVNFDFDGNTNTNYVGIFNIFAPDLTRSDKFGSFGLNAGVMKINYSKSGDSINTSYFLKENILIRPLDSIKMGKKYLVQFNKLSTTTKNNTYSFYLQPIIRLHSSNTAQKADFFFHLHTELLVNKWTTTTTIKNIQQDTGVMNNSHEVYHPINNFAKSTGDAYTTSSTLTTLSGYFGGGLTIIIKPWPKAKIFIQPTFGATLNYSEPSSVSQSTFKPTYDPVNWHAFYLTRFYLRQQLTSNIDFVLGADFRGIFPKENPNYACYIGANIGLDGIAKLLK